MGIKTISSKIKRKISKAFAIDKGLSTGDKKILLKLDRYQTHEIKFFGHMIKIVDSVTFLSSYDEIFKKEIYKFISGEKNISIVDCGANIGLSTIYLKMNFPDAHIVAFEPDPNIYAALKYNIGSFGYKDIVCKNEAVSNVAGVVNFWLEGGHSGMIIDEDNAKKAARIKSTRLKSVLNDYERVTFLKIDIEGEEVNVIPDIADQLKKVDYLFLEYHSFLNRNQTLGEILTIIQAAGMRYYVEEATHKPLPFINREIYFEMDLLVNIFCYW